MKSLGHDFGSTPFGYESVRQAAEQQGHQLLDLRRRDCAVCLLDLYPIADVRCPVHGLEAFLRERLAGRGLREELVQTAAVAVAWIEELDNRGGQPRA
jgi:hypothetical protein